VSSRVSEDRVYSVLIEDIIKQTHTHTYMRTPLQMKGEAEYWLESWRPLGRGLVREEVCIAELMESLCNDRR